MSLLDLIKRTAIEAFNSTNPVNLIFGVVTKAEPLEIEIHSKLTLTREFLLIAEHLTRHDRIVTIRYEFPKTWDKDADIGDEVKSAASSRNYIGSPPAIPYGKYELSNTKMTFENVLKKGDKVSLVRMQGGHKFFVMDRVVEA
ncbi:DUF2577 domain-containing protein [Sporosarcina sp. ANT_H38]|uniref:DUF2577 domain-containing protein n=1 Tax=Sporosarcina sp. ANT_H38 TaxID=2597358 RepID=UPI0011F3466C|nr:DUF2577 domain-containing protein [Sporosarcina sp. ANT_H38]KAA0944067.1 DUF2577 domain-containing protein [Sporosarcina sp. ANT_H38]